MSWKHGQAQVGFGEEPLGRFPWRLLLLAMLWIFIGATFSEAVLGLLGIAFWLVIVPLAPVSFLLAARQPAHRRRDFRAWMTVCVACCLLVPTTIGGLAANLMIKDAVRTQRIMPLVRALHQYQADHGRPAPSLGAPEVSAFQAAAASIGDCDYAIEGAGWVLNVYVGAEGFSNGCTWIFRSDSPVRACRCDDP